VAISAGAVVSGAATTAASVESTPSVAAGVTSAAVVSGAGATTAGGGVSYHCITPATPNSRLAMFSTAVPNCSFTPVETVKREGITPVTMTP